jgi:AraC family transcriptional regulator
MAAETQTFSNAAFQPDDVETNTQAGENISIQSNFDVARWNVDKNNISYLKNDSHTLSMYLRGGQTSYRNDQNSQKGAPGKICLMPQGQESTWCINGEIDFIHLYFSDATLKQYAASTFATDVRLIELRDLTYQQDSKLQALFRQYFSLCDAALFSSPLFAEETINEVMHHLIKNYNGFRLRNTTIKGGLSAQHLRKIRNLIEERIDEKHSIEQLAQTINLSPFHFARMFKVSFGESPAAYVTRKRIEAVKTYLKSNLPLVEISALTGFSQQSHMSTHFKIITGLTPGAYRQLL